MTDTFSDNDCYWNNDRDGQNFRYGYDDRDGGDERYADNDYEMVMMSKVVRLKIMKRTVMMT